MITQMIITVLIMIMTPTTMVLMTIILVVMPMVIIIMTMSTMDMMIVTMRMVSVLRCTTRPRTPPAWRSKLQCCDWKLGWRGLGNKGGDPVRSRANFM